MDSQAASAFVHANAPGAVVGKAGGRLPAGLALLLRIDGAGRSRSVVVAARAVVGE